MRAFFTKLTSLTLLALHAGMLNAQSLQTYGPYGRINHASSDSNHALSGFLLPHRLEPGDSVFLYIDATQTRGPLNKKVLGVSFFLPGDGPVYCPNDTCLMGLPIDRWGTYTLNNYPSGNFENPIRNLSLRMTRVYDLALYDRAAHAGMQDSQGYASFNAQTALDKWHFLATQLGIPEENIVLGVGLYIDTTVGRDTIFPRPGMWRQLVGYSVSRGFGFRHWEIGNEVYVLRELDWITGSRRIPENGFIDYTNLQASIRRFKNYFIAVRDSIRSVQPNAQLGISIPGGYTDLLSGRSDSLDQPHWTFWKRWGKQILDSLAGYYDFIVGHYYVIFECGEVSDTSFTRFVLAHNYALMENQLRTLHYARSRPGNVGRIVYHYDTEWGAGGTRYAWPNCYGPNGDKWPDREVRNGNLFGTLYEAVRLIYYLREGIVEGASAWNVFTRRPQTEPAFGFLTHQSPANRSFSYWLYVLFNRFIGDSVLSLSGTAPFYSTIYSNPAWDPVTVSGPYTPAIATWSSSDTSLSVIIANGHATGSFAFRCPIMNFRGDWVQANLFTDFRPGSWLDNPAFSTDSSDFIRTYSVSLMAEQPLYRTLLRGTLPPRSVLFIKVKGRRAPQIVLTPRDTLRFGAVPVNRVDTLSVLITNIGGDTLRTSSMTVPPAGVFTTWTPSLIVAPNDSDIIRVSFAPTDSTAAYQATLMIISNDPDPLDDTVFVVLTGRGTSITSVETHNTSSTDYRLEANYPNPFNPTTTIRFALPQREHVIVKVFDVLGREVGTLVNEVKQPGRHEVVWDAAGIPSGVYFYRMSTKNFIETKKLVLLR